MNEPKSLDDIRTLIRSEVQENIHLDYKDSRALKKDGRSRDTLAKDVSAFANSDGGTLIYVVRENGHIPIETDDGVSDREVSREWIESAVMTGITPRLEGVVIVPIPLSPGRSLYVIHVQKSFGGPHQATDKRYYKRHNFSSVPMEDYEIADVRNRKHRRDSIVSFQVGFYRDLMGVFDVSNVGTLVAEDVSFTFSETVPWPDDKPMPRPLAEGIRRLAPGQRLRFRYFTSIQLFNKSNAIQLAFSVTVGYFHPEVNGRVSEEWPINF